MAAFSAYAGLVLAAFLAATLLPAQSEALLAALLLSGEYSVAGLVAAASFGNVVGSLVNWWLGRSLDRFRGRRWFPLSEVALARARRWFARFGLWSLLFAWLPVVGDPLTLLAGAMRVPLGRFLALVALGKVARYAVLAWAVLGLD